MSRSRGVLWIATFAFFLLVFPLSYCITKKYVNTLSYGQRNASYTYFDHGTYINTAQTQIEEVPEAPKLSIENYKEFSSLYESYFDQILPYKKLLIRLNHTIQYYLFRQTCSSAVTVGKSGWLFYTPSIKYTVDPGDFTQEELASIAANFTTVAQSLQAQGKEFILFIAPNKATVYPEYLPDYYKKDADLPSKTEQLVSYLKQNTDIHVVFPVEELMQAKQSMPDIDLYHKLDTHWNSAGAYIGAQSIANELGMQLPPLSTLTLKEFFFKESDLTNMFGMPIESGTKDYALTNYGEENTRLISWDCRTLIQYETDTKEKKLVLLGDSFRVALSSSISPLFRTSEFYELSPTWSEDLPYTASADVVVVEYVERYVNSIKNFCLS